MSSQRNKRILMDNLSGIPMQQIADREGVHLSRVGQIVQREKAIINWHPGMTKQAAGAACARRPMGCAEPGSPEWFYSMLAREERMNGTDMEGW